METNIQNIKMELIQWLTTVEDKSILDKLVEFRSQQTKDWWNEISDSEKSSIKKGLLDSEKGNLNSHSKAREVYEKWL